MHACILFLKTEGKKSPFSKISRYVCTGRAFILGQVVQSWVNITQVGGRFEFRFESLKSISVLIRFVHKLMIESSKNNRELSQKMLLNTRRRNPG